MGRLRLVAAFGLLLPASTLRSPSLTYRTLGTRLFLGILHLGILPDVITCFALISSC